VCFSATANFVGSGVLGTAGIVTLTKVKHRRELLFAALPFRRPRKLPIEPLRTPVFVNRLCERLKIRSIDRPFISKLCRDKALASLSWGVLSTHLAHRYLENPRKTAIFE